MEGKVVLFSSVLKLPRIEIEFLRWIQANNYGNKYPERQNIIDFADVSVQLHNLFHRFLVNHRRH